MARVLDIAIVGYGIAGIAVAIQLRRQGHRITHFDRNDPPTALGAGMLLHPPALRRLEELGVLSAALACGAPVRRIRAQSKSGRPIMDFGYGEMDVGTAGLGIQRGTLHRLLANADDGCEQVIGNHEISAISADCGIVVGPSNIRHGPFDVVVVADGANSLLRDQIKAPVIVNRRSDSAALVGLLDDPNEVAGDHLVQYYDSSQHVSVWPVGSERPAGPQKCAIAMNVSLADAQSFRDRGVWRQLLARHCPAVGTLVTADIDNDSLHIFCYRDIELSQYGDGRVVLVGDAAHSMSPQLGNGAHLALQDAARLADILDKCGDCSNALQIYARSRPQEVRRHHRASRWLTPLFQSDSLLSAVLRDHALPNAMLLPDVQRVAYALLR